MQAGGGGSPAETLCRLLAVWSAVAKKQHAAFGNKEEFKMTLSKMALVAREQLRSDVKDYAKTLSDVVNGSEWFCEQYVDYDNGETSEDYPDAYTRLAKYFDYDEPMDLQFIVDARGEYLGAKFALALDGHAIYFDTREGWVQGYWGSDYAEAPVSDWTRTDIDDYFREQWDCVR